MNGRYRLTAGLVALFAVTGCHAVMGWEESEARVVDSGGAAGQQGVAGSGGMDASVGGSSGHGTTGGNAGQGGEAGSGGAAGDGGAAGIAGASGHGGMGGSSGQAGQGGQGGLSGQGGSSGTGGTAGQGGGGGVGGSAGSGGQGGAGGSGGCTDGAVLCSGNVLKKCQNNAWVKVETCQGATPVCSMAARKCVVCIAGTATCDGKVLKVCDATGGSTTDQTCDSPALCDPVGKRCIPSTGGRVTQIDSSENTACAVLRDGGLRCWGRDQYGQIILANENEPQFRMRYSATAVDLGQSVKVSSVSVGSSHSCAVVDADRHVLCWGSNVDGKLGASGDRVQRPVTVTGLTGVKKVMAGNEFTCALLSDSTVSCWGNNRYGQLGDGTTTSRWSPKVVSGLSDVVQIRASSRFVCARTSKQQIYCWGNGKKIAPHQVGVSVSPVDFALSGTSLFLLDDKGAVYKVDSIFDNPTESLYNSYPPFVQISSASLGITSDHRLTGFPSSHTVVEHVASASGRCYLTTGGKVYCWGQINVNPVGNGLDVIVRQPVQVKGIQGATKIFISGMSSMVQLSDGSVWGWGHNESVFWNHVTYLDPVSLIHFDGVDFLGCSCSSSGNYTYVQKASGLLVSFRSGGKWGLENIRLAKPAGQKFLSVHSSLLRFGWYLDVGLSANHKVKLLCSDSRCNQYGVLGKNDNTAQKDTVYEVPLNNVQKVAGADTLCALLDTQRVYCWGANAMGQVGNGKTDRSGVWSPSPVQFPDNDAKIKDLCVGRSHSCAVGVNGKVYCWGNGTYGQLGLGVARSYYSSPVPAYFDSRAPSFRQVECGGDTTCAVAGDGSVYCWGRGNLAGIGSYEEKILSPQRLSSLSSISKVKMGPEHACALDDKGRVYCWGYQGYGEAGAGYPRSYSFGDAQLVVGLN